MERWEIRTPCGFRWFLRAALTAAAAAAIAAPAFAAPVVGDPPPDVAIGPGRPSLSAQVPGPILPRLPFVEGTSSSKDVSASIQFLLLLTVLATAPTLALMVTAYARIVIVLSFVERAIAAQGMPPRQILFSLALFLTFFVMAPTIAKVKTGAWDPYQRGEINTFEAYERGIVPFRDFMLQNTREHDLALFVRLSGEARPHSADDVPTWVLVPAFMVSEITTSFMMGVLIFIPFLVIDMVIASVLMSMGMIMLPPVLISLPFKILLFVLVDGWSLVCLSLVRSYGGAG